MRQITLKALVDEIGQTAAAVALGVTPPAISKALSRKRKIEVLQLPDGSYSAHEVKPFPSVDSKAIPVASA